MTPDCTVDKFKSQLLIKDFNQWYEIVYFNKTCSTVPRVGTLIAILSIAASERNILSQFVESTFLFGDFEEGLYMQQPNSYDVRTSKICVHS